MNENYGLNPIKSPPDKVQITRKAITLVKRISFNQYLSDLQVNKSVTRASETTVVKRISFNQH